MRGRPFSRRLQSKIDADRQHVALRRPIEQIAGKGLLARGCVDGGVPLWPQLQSRRGYPDGDGAPRPNDRLAGGLQVSGPCCPTIRMADVPPLIDTQEPYEDAARLTAPTPGHLELRGDAERAEPPRHAEPRIDQAQESIGQSPGCGPARYFPRGGRTGIGHDGGTLAEPIGMYVARRAGFEPAT